MRPVGGCWGNEWLGLKKIFFLKFVAVLYCALLCVCVCVCV